MKSNKNNKKFHIKNNEHILWLTRASTFISLIISWQIFTARFKNPMLTGTIVNFFLIISCKICGLSAGAFACVISPIVAKILGIGPIWVLVPFLSLGNLSLVIVWRIMGKIQNRLINFLCAIIGAITKFFVLRICVVGLVLPLLHLPEKQGTLIFLMFGINQLITALLGGILASVILPILKKTIDFF